MVTNPKLDKYISDSIKNDAGTRLKDRYGVIAAYDKATNTATVILTSPISDEFADIIRHVPCPTTMGLQTAAPEIGRGCWVTFDGLNQQNPYIVSFMNQHYAKYDYQKQNTAYSGLPRYLLED